MDLLSGLVQGCSKFGTACIWVVAKVWPGRIDGWDLMTLASRLGAPIGTNPKAPQAAVDRFWGRPVCLPIFPERQPSSNAHALGGAATANAAEAAGQTRASPSSLEYLR